MTVYLDSYYAREADRIARGPQLYGGNAEILKLRCFKFYHPDSGSWLTDPDGRSRWLGPKMSRVYAILHRHAGSGQRVTMKAVAGEAMCCTSTVSRAVTKLQAFGFLAVDVRRGRNGGMLIRLRSVGDTLKAYAQAAWRKLRSAARNVASTLPGREGVPMDYLEVPTDATFSRDQQIADLGARVLAGEISIDYARALTGNGHDRPTEADREWQRAEQFARDVIAERRRLDAEDPHWT